MHPPGPFPPNITMRQSLDTLNPGAIFSSLGTLVQEGSFFLKETSFIYIKYLMQVIATVV